MHFHHIRQIPRCLAHTYESRKAVVRFCLPRDPRFFSVRETSTRWQPDPSLVDYTHYRPPNQNDDETSDIPPVVVYPNAIDTEEQELLEQAIIEQGSRRRYQRGHWDAVILDYREFALDPSFVTSSRILDTVVQGLTERHATRAIAEWLSPHAIDLKADGEIRPHVDSVRFSGDLVCGISLLSTSIMRLVPVAENEQSQAADKEEARTGIAQRTSSDGDVDTPSCGYIDILLPPRSLYVLQGLGRYHMTHALRPSGSIFAPLNLTVLRDRRLSIILRDAKGDDKHQQ